MAASERAPPIARLCEETEQGAATPLADDDEEASPEDVAQKCRIGGVNPTAALGHASVSLRLHHPTAENKK